MSRITLKALLAHEGDALLTRLHDAEEALKRAIHGIWLFIVKKIPELSRHLLIWLQEKFNYACRVAVRLARVAAFFLALLVIVFAPLAIYPSIITSLWSVLAIAGSAFGVQRQIGKQQQITIHPVKGVRRV